MQPQRILQFGTGRFLRGFADAFVHAENARAARDPGGTIPVRTIDVVESTGSGTAARLAAQDCAYRLLVRGLREGRVVDAAEVITSIGRTIDGRARPDAVLAAGLEPDCRFVVSNTTEAGYARGAFPARLLEVLAARARADLPGLVILPCELVERNGDRLRELVLAEAGAAGLEGRVRGHIRDANTWAVTLVDRIVTTPPPGTAGAAGDPLAVAAEPFAQWLVEVPPETPLIDHAAVHRVVAVDAFALRKIRILNGAHTALVARAIGGPHTLVRQAMEDPATVDWLEGLLREEIVPALGERITDGDAYTAAVLERFRNPFLDHRLADIALHHATKLATRLLPTYHDHIARFGRPPRRLGALLTREGIIG